MISPHCAWYDVVVCSVVDTSVDEVGFPGVVVVWTVVVPGCHVYTS